MTLDISFTPHPVGETMAHEPWKLSAELIRPLAADFNNGCVFLANVRARDPGAILPWGDSNVQLKLLDRRVCEPSSPAYNRPWTEAVEDQIQSVWRRIQAGELLDGPVVDLCDFDAIYDEEKNDLRVFDDWTIEKFRYDCMLRLWRTEVSAYNRLRPLQGHGIPRFFGTVQLRRSDIADSENLHPLFYHVPGLLLEYTDGQDLYHFSEAETRKDDTTGTFPTDEEQTHGRAALDVLRRAHSLGVSHNDIRRRNIIVRPNGSYVIIDWGCALLRSASQTDADWTEGLTKPQDLHELRWWLWGRWRYDMSPWAREPEPKYGYKHANERIEMFVRNKRRRAQWFEEIPFREPGFEKRIVDGEEIEWHYERWRLRPGVHTQDMYDGKLL
ncbi:hypothetical protein EXIGLDRAFT_191546 [Exidia glandulosa HHB12029]|uniref:Protein kinase domain-containing protein n=1 Tax=Exidia glandulosa HHB12029 TaxID=1314781 RepID=A0A165N0T9_EXIGL|nr:hypothetical protein EXIGLDRAFT_191546 [Exidia glandulosa HHB12029]